MRWREHRLLLVVAAGSLLLAGVEVATPEVGMMESATPPPSLLDVDRSIVTVLSELYPDRTSTFYFQAMQSYLCSMPPHRRKPTCRGHDGDRAREMESLLGQAVTARNRSNEKVVYNFALVLIGLDAPDEQVDAVIRSWRLDHPYSKLPDPRTFARSARPDPRPETPDGDRSRRR